MRLEVVAVAGSHVRTVVVSLALSPLWCLLPLPVHAGNSCLVAFQLSWRPTIDEEKTCVKVRGMGAKKKPDVLTTEYVQEMQGNSNDS